MVDQITFGGELQPPEQDQISFDNLKSPTILSDEQTNVRAAKATYALNDPNRGVESIKNGMLSGREQTLRESTARLEEAKLRRERVSMVQDALSTRTTPLSQEEEDELVSVLSTDLYVDPETIFEKKFGERMVGDYALNAYEIWRDANPVDVYNDLDSASSTIARQEITKSVLQELQAKENQQSWIGWGLDIAETMIPFKTNYNTHNIVTPSSSLLPGENLDDQVKYLLQQPPEQFKRLLTKAVDELEKTNPQDAIRFASAVLSYTGSAKFFDNLFGVADVADVGAVGVGLAKGAARGARRIARGRQLGEEAGTVPPVGQTPASGAPGPFKRTPASEKAPSGDMFEDTDFDEWYRTGVQSAKDEKQSDPATWTPREKELWEATHTAENREEAVAAFSRERGYTEAEINNFLRHHELSDQFVEKYGVDTVAAISRDIYESDDVQRVLRERAMSPEPYGPFNDLLRVNSDPSAGPSEIMNAMGRNTDAAVYDATLARQQLGRDGAISFRNVARVTQSIFSPQNLVANAGNFSAAASQRILNVLKGTAQTVQNAVTNPNRIARLTDDALDAGLAATEDALRNREFNHVQNGIMDVGYVSRDPTVAGTYETYFDLVRTDQSMFSSSPEAFAYADRIVGLNPADYDIMQQGPNFYIRVYRTLDETMDPIRDVMARTNKPDGGLVNTVAGWFRSRDDLVDPFTRGQAKAAQALANRYNDYARQVAADIGTLPKKQRKNVERLLRVNRDADVQNARGEWTKGEWCKDLADFEMQYRQTNNAAPTEAEAAAYFKVVQLNDFDYISRNFGVYRDKSRHGVKQVTFRYENPEGMSGLVTRESPSVEAKKVDVLPWDKDEAFTILVNEKGSPTRVVKSNMLDESEKAYIMQLIDQEGHQIYEVYQALMQKPFKRMTGVDDPIQFVVTNNSREARLKIDQLPYNEGGHRVYDVQHFVKQPSMIKGIDGGTHYTGDATAMGFKTEAEAAKYAPIWDEARQIMNAGGDLRGYLARNLPISEAQFRALFEDALDASGNTVKARFSKYEPFVATPSGKKTVDIHRGITFDQDMTRSAYGNYTNLDKEFTSTRDPDLWTVREMGSQANPAINLETAPLLDVFPTLNKSMRNIMGDYAMNDYRISAVELYARNFAEVMNVTPEEFLADPLTFLRNPNLDLANPNKELLAQARNNARSIITFLGTETDVGKNIRWLQDKLLNSVYSQWGQGASNFVSDRLIKNIKNPADFARAFAFHTKLGLFNPAQFFMQAQSAVHVMAIAGPKNGYRGVAAGTLMQALRMSDGDPAKVKHFAKMASKLGLGKADEFEESYHAMVASGWDLVEGEAAFRNATTDPTVFESSLGKVLDKGTVFFKQGERFVRLAAWNAAYREWKDANPLRAMSALDRQRIVDRADLMSVNMTRASNAAWQSNGFLTVPTQFLAFQARLAEQLLGKRLTPQEWRRAFLMYSTVYGLPVGLGANFAVYPFYEDVRKEGLKNGIPMDSTVINALHNGISSTILEFITGQQYNTGERLGPGGMSLTREIIDGDKSFLDVVLGPAGTIIGDTIRAMDPVIGDMAGLASGETSPKLSMNDFMNVARNISTVDKAYNLYQAYNVGKHITKNGTVVSDVNGFDALVTAFTGLTPTETSDAFLKLDILKDEQTNKKEAGKQISNDLKRAWIALKDQDYDLYVEYRKRADAGMVAAGLNAKERSDLVAFSVKGNTLVESVDRRWFKSEQQRRMSDPMKQLKNIEAQ